jgi:SprT protein
LKPNSLKYSKSLLPYVPNKSASDWLSTYIVNNNLLFKISKDRKSKLGDFRVDFNKKISISINGTLNKDLFFFTCLHEIAHHVVYLKHQGKVAPHGKEWKATFGKIILEHINKFDKEHLITLSEFALKPRGTHVRNFLSSKAEICNKPVLFDQSVGFEFKFRGDLFKKIQNKRTRVLCENIATNRQYLISGNIIVETNI